MTFTETPVAEIAICPSCSARNAGGQPFCQQCGQQLQEPRDSQAGPPPAPAAQVVSRRSPSKLGNLAASQRSKEIRSARIAIMVVAVLTMLSAVAYWMMLNAEIQKIQTNPSMFVVGSAVREARLLIGATFAVGVVFLGLFFWAKRNPFGATLTALIIYLTSMVASAAVDPSAISKGILVKVIVIACLVKGVQAGLAYKRLAAGRD